MSDSLAKGVGILLGGVFIGAVSAEIINRRLLQNAAGKACSAIRDHTKVAKDSFVSAYKNASTPVAKKTVSKAAPKAAPSGA